VPEPTLARADFGATTSFQGLQRVPIVFQNRSRGRRGRLDFGLGLATRRRNKMAHHAVPIARVRSPLSGVGVRRLIVKL
jgi:hypothetical protein